MQEQLLLSSSVRSSLASHVETIGNVQIVVIGVKMIILLDL